jgi:hypothetical protein
MVLLIILPDRDQDRMVPVLVILAKKKVSVVVVLDPLGLANIPLTRRLISRCIWVKVIFIASAIFGMLFLSASDPLM